MTPTNLARHANHEAMPFWMTLKEGYDYFEVSRQLPTIAVCNRRYVVNVAMRNGDVSRLDPERACPAFVKPQPTPFTPRPGEPMAEQRIVMPGPKMRALAGYEGGPARSSPTATGTTTGSLLPSMSHLPVQ
jgi:hypothetical protein